MNMLGINIVKKRFLNFKKNFILPLFLFVIFVTYANPIWLGVWKEETSPAPNMYSLNSFVQFNYNNIILDRRCSVVVYYNKLLIILVLSLLLSLLLSKIISKNLRDFKITGENKNIDLSFVLIFLALLTLPSISLDNRERSNLEARALATYKPIYDAQTRTINAEFGKDINNFYNDRFWGRIYLVYLNKEIIYRLSNHYAKYDSKLVDKRNMELYNDWEIPVFESRKVNIINNELERFSYYCRENNIKPYILATPGKNFEIPIDAIKSNNEEIIRNLEILYNNKNYSFIFSPETFIDVYKTTKKRLHFRTDHHLTDDGSFIQYKLLMQKITKDFPDIKVLTDKDFDYFYDKKVRSEKSRSFKLGYTCRLIGFPDIKCQSLTDEKYKYYRHKDYELIDRTEIDISDLQATKFYNPKGQDYKLMIIGDSSIENMMEFLPYTFKYVYKIRLNGPFGIPEYERYKLLKNYAGEIEKFKPDILVLDYLYTTLYRLKKINIRK